MLIRLMHIRVYMYMWVSVYLYVHAYVYVHNCCNLGNLKNAYYLHGNLLFINAYYLYSVKIGTVVLEI